MKVLTKGELHKIEKRVEELENIIELCDPGRDDDILANSESELDEIVNVLEKSYKAARIKEVGLRLIQGGKK